jgi:site-specific DNA-methyltransferase (adenine-specific)
MYTFAGETVLDSFLGSGTTALAAAKAGRNSIGYEINREFEPVIRAKLAAADASLELQSG